MNFSRDEAESHAAFQLRPYQLQSVENINAEFQQGKTSVLLVAPTGSGKTAIGCHFVKQTVDRNQRCLWIAHRSELIRQASARLAEDYKIRHGLILANGFGQNANAAVQVASVQTLARRAPIGTVGLIVVDEAHHATAPSYMKVIERHPGALILGLTATPWRLAGRRLDTLFDGLVAVANYPFLIDQGYLVRPRVFTPAIRPDFSAVRFLAGDYDEAQAGAVMCAPHLVGDVVEQWKKHSARDQPRSTIVFACTVAHSLQITDRFRAIGVSAEHLDSQTPDEERKAIVARLSHGKTQVVSNVMILSEGFDCPRVSTVVIARPTASKTLYLQMVGRALRPCSSINKTDCIILDHAGNSFRHGLVSEITNYHLESGEFIDVAAEPILRCKECPRCHAIISTRSKVCGECGHSFESISRLPTQVPGELVEKQSRTVPSKTLFGIGGIDRGDTHLDVAPPTSRQSSDHSQYLDRTMPASRNEKAESAKSAPKECRQVTWIESCVSVFRHRDAAYIRDTLREHRHNISSASISQIWTCVEAALLSENCDIWVQTLAELGMLGDFRLNAVLAVRNVVSEDRRRLSPFNRTKRALKASSPSLAIRFASLLFAAGIPEVSRRAASCGFKQASGYATRSKEIAQQVLEEFGVGDDIKGRVLDLIQQHEYVFTQILEHLDSPPDERLAERFRRRLGTVWRDHFAFASCIWDGPIAAWIARNTETLASAIKKIESTLMFADPAESSLLDGNQIIERYKLPKGPWIKVMKEEIGKWCIANPHIAHDADNLVGAADSIFACLLAADRQFNPGLSSMSTERCKLPDWPWIRMLKAEIGKWRMANPRIAHDSDSLINAANTIFTSFRAKVPLFNSDIPFIINDIDSMVSERDPLEVLPILASAAKIRCTCLPPDGAS